MNNFNQYLNKFSTNIQPFTHLNLQGGKYNILDNKLDEFYNEYHKAFEKKSGKIHLVEVHKPIGPIVIDIDFRYRQGKVTRFNDNIIFELVKTYQEIIKTCLKVDNINLECFVFVKSKIKIETTYGKDGIHLMFPYIHTKPDVQYLVRENIIKIYHENQSFKSLELTKTNTLEDIFDKSVIYKNGWIMYGSSKLKSDPYKLSHILDYKQNELPLNKYSDVELIKLLSIHRKEQISEPLNSVLDELSKINLELSKPKFKQPANPIFKNKSDSDILADVQSLMNLLSDERAFDYNKWISLGWCLHNIDYCLLPVWNDFSKKSIKYKEGYCEKLWCKFKNEGYNIGSIKFWAKTDNLEGYKEYLQKKVNSHILGFIKKNLKCTHNDVAKIVEMNYEHTYVCASLKFDLWFHFNGVRWVKTEKGHELRKLLSSEISNEFSKSAESLIKLSYEDNGNDNNFRDGAKKCLETSTQLKSTKYKNDCMVECKELLYDKNFLGKLDSNIYLIGFENGVYDLKENIFRNGSPNDYVSYTTNINYVEYDENNTYIKEVYSLLKKIQPDPELFEYLLMSLSSYLDGQIAHEKFIIWTGTGSNGKSLLVLFFEQIFGDYCTKLPISLLTRSRGSSSAASPEIAKTLGKRFCVMQEPEENDRINVGLMKEITGGDKIEARGLYQEPVIFKPQFKLLLTCNELPKIPSNDGGTWRRLRVLPFLSEFVDEPIKENQFKKDPHLSEKLKQDEYVEAFMSILLHYYKMYQEHGLHEPSEVLKYTSEYRKCSDLYSEFIEDNIDYDIGIDKSKLSTQAHIYAIFKDWYRENRPDSKCPPKTDLKTSFEKKYGKCIRANGGLCWKGIYMKLIEDVSDSFEEI